MTGSHLCRAVGLAWLLLGTGLAAAQTAVPQAPAAATATAAESDAGFGTPQAASGQGGAATAPPPAGMVLPPLPELPPVEGEAYKRVAGQAAPLSPDQIRTLHKLVVEAEQAAADTPGGAVRPVTSTVIANLSPGAQSPVVRVAMGHVTNLLFIDAYGAPLPITNVALGGAQGWYEVTSPTAENGLAPNLLKISPMRGQLRGGLSVSLRGIPAPVTLTVVSGQREVDHRVDVRVRSAGLAAGAVESGGSAFGRQRPVDLFVLGSPEDAQVLGTSEPSVTVWRRGGHYFLRSPFKLLSPAFIDMSGSGDGTTVYELAQASALVVLRDNMPFNIQVVEN